MGEKRVKKLRVDELVVKAGLATDLESARRLIMAGEIRSGDRVLDKAGEKIPQDLPLERKPRTLQVSRGARKLAHALDAFLTPVGGTRCLDIGASTGGFTSVLLNAGAVEVTALDVGYGLIDTGLRNDPRVRVIERTNFRTIPDDFFPEPFDLIVADVSFISLRMIIPRAFQFLKEGGSLLALIKPQFEAPPEKVEQGGIVREFQTHCDVVILLAEALGKEGFYLHAIDPIPVEDPKKNLEIFSHWRREPSPFGEETIVKTIETAHERG